MNVKQQLRNYIHSKLFDDDELLQDDEELIQSGILDSMAQIQLANHLEIAYGINLEVGEIDEENFSSIRRLEKFVSMQLKAMKSKETKTSKPLVCSSSVFEPETLSV